MLHSLVSKLALWIVLIGSGLWLLKTHSFLSFQIIHNWFANKAILCCRNSFPFLISLNFWSSHSSILVTVPIEGAHWSWEPNQTGAIHEHKRKACSIDSLCWLQIIQVGELIIFLLNKFYFTRRAFWHLPEEHLYFLWNINLPNKIPNVRILKGGGWWVVKIHHLQVFSTMIAWFN